MAWWTGATLALGLGVYGGYRAFRALFQNFGPLGPARISRADVTAFLNYALALEKEQVEFYRRLSRGVARRGGDLHLATGIKRAMDIEQEHVDKLRGCLARLGASASNITPVAALLGRASGPFLDKSGPRNTLKAIVWIEQKAIDHYLRAIRQVDDPGLKALFLENLVDEEFHAAWAQEMLEQLRRPGDGDNF